MSLDARAIEQVACLHDDEARVALGLLEVQAVAARERTEATALGTEWDVDVDLQRRVVEDGRFGYRAEDGALVERFVIREHPVVDRVARQPRVARVEQRRLVPRSLVRRAAVVRDRPLRLHGRPSISDGGRASGGEPTAQTTALPYGGVRSLVLPALFNRRRVTRRASDRRPGHVRLYDEAGASVSRSRNDSPLTRVDEHERVSGLQDAAGVRVGRSRRGGVRPGRRARACVLSLWRRACRHRGRQRLR